MFYLMTRLFPKCQNNLAITPKHAVGQAIFYEFIFNQKLLSRGKSKGVIINSFSILLA